MKSSILLSFLIVVPIVTATAETKTQDVNDIVCNAQYSDADGDGYGWENNSSCIVTNESAPPPTIINEETGQVVELIRPYWDGNKDIANRKIQCDLYFFDDISRVYTPAPDGWPPTSFEFNHLPLPSANPFLGWLESWRTNGAPYWTIVDGLYRGGFSGGGPTMLREEYIEAVTDEFGNKAIRVWVDEGYRTGLDFHQESWVQEDGFYQCRDTSGEDFFPSGVPGQPSAVEYSLADTTISVSDADNPQYLPMEPNSINLETGQPVILQKLYWDYNADLAGETIDCASYTWRSDAYRQGIQQPTIYTFDYLVQGNNSIHFHSYFEGQQRQMALPLERGIIEPDGAVFVSQKGEITDQGVRFWFSSELHLECFGAVPTGTAPEETSNIADGVNENPQPVNTESNETNIISDDINTEEQTGNNLLVIAGSAEQGGGAISFFGIFLLLLTRLTRRPLA